ncbi:cob(I)yrinic acid a,c-diamide adenosyltransferase [Xylanibacillus composti]|uniref:Corrinoid adenosyltransferase n=1 Tax=Xylanibacillus composti TaxID=1572762 RepID=A0A8J4M4R0_9BACL|nr:cob(I)yrinic acid a,c-diamide adenosyltransferase [Xylanibacillus composti]MDT9724685.1 cob(I)yrinic acid a,c-diamide adenosyltransferase [Xylanibacillus composti]GIQ70971.1 Cob(I)yrinic acid a,c-diamide adenosyltransferase [Xylanibacillus composti]
MKIYTRTGDQGETGVIGGRVPKNSVRVEAYGTVDELNSFIGLAVSSMAEDRYSDMRADLLEIQHELFDCGADLATLHARSYKVEASMTDRLEAAIDRYEKETSALSHFVLPGGSAAAAHLHISRTVCRRAERRVVELALQEEINIEVRTYLNRLSDFLFMLARAANAREGVEDIHYVRGGQVFRTRS